MKIKEELEILRHELERLERNYDKLCRNCHAIDFRLADQNLRLINLMNAVLVEVKSLREITKAEIEGIR